MTTTAAYPPNTGRSIAVGMLVWLGIALVASATGLLAALTPPAPQLIILALVIATVAVGTSVPAVRAWIDAVPIRVLVGIHVSRYVGIVFLAMAARGALSPIFASRAGWGDIAAATLAAVLVLVGDPVTRGRRTLYLAWNVIALADLVVAVGTATWVTLRGLTPGVQPLVHLPLSLVITFAVPILLASHVFLFRRLRAEAAR